jgi:signal transduction histidine kinase
MPRNGIAARAALGFALVSSITAAAVVTSRVLTAHEADRGDEMLARYGDDFVHATQIQAAAERMVAASRGYLLTEEPAFLDRARQAESQLDDALLAMDRTEALPSEQRLLSQVRLSAARYRGRLDEILETTSATEDRASLGKTLRERLAPARETLDDAIEGLVAHKQRLAQEAHRTAARIRTQTSRITMAMGAIALVMSVLLAWRFTRGLTLIYRREQESSRRATEALRAKEELLGIVAHDLRSPLGAILLRATGIARQTEAEPVRASASAIQATCKRMANLIASLLDAASVEAGRLSVTKGRCEVAQLFSDLLETFGPAASAKAIRLEQAITSSDMAVDGDQKRLFQVLSNLVGNALSFTEEGGVIAVSASGGGGVVRFQVRDTGPGIPDEHLPRVFERYWKAGSPGAGLGLYIARGIVAAHGGRIWVENNPDHGATFAFEIPSVSRERSAPLRAEAAAVPSHGEQRHDHPGPV